MKRVRKHQLFQQVGTKSRRRQEPPYSAGMSQSYQSGSMKYNAIPSTLTNKNTFGAVAAARSGSKPPHAITSMSDK